MTEINATIAAFPEPRLIPHVVSYHAKNDPNKVWGSIPRSESDASQGYEDITFARLNYAISRACQWLVDVVEPDRRCKFEPLAYIGPPDSRYIILTIAAIKTGYQTLYLSPRNSDEAQQSVIREASCQKFISARSTEVRIKKLIQSCPQLSDMTCYVVPEQSELLKDEILPDYPYNRALEQARYEPLVTLHTSSTTGIPKTIPLNQGYGLHEDAVQHVPKYDGLDIITRKPFYGRCRMFVAMPLFHAGGVLLTLLKSLYHDIVSVFQPPFAALNAEVFDGILRYGNCTGCVIPPYLLEQMLEVPAYFDTLASLDFVQFGSGPLSKAAGDQLLTRQNDCPHYIGSSECGLYLLLELDDPIADWQYFRFHPWSGVEMRQIDDHEDTPRELFVVRTPEGRAVPGIQPVFELFPELEEWPTRDLYVRHPTKSDHWRCIGRNDDVIVLSNGEKLNPVDTESRVVNSHSKITAALVIGHGRFAPGLLLEVRDVDVKDPLQRASLVDEIWPSVQVANKEAAGHGQVSKALIMLTSSSKPFLRTPKLSVRRKPTIDLYAQEIEKMYDDFEENSGGIEAQSNETIELDLTSPAGIQNFVRESVASVTGWDDIPGEDEDLFMLGMDSLQALRIARAMKAGLSSCGNSIEFGPRQVYNNPTINALSAELEKVVTGPTGVAATRNIPSDREDMIESLITKYSIFDTEAPLKEDASTTQDNATNGNRPFHIILTGTTGSLGSNILFSLLKNPNVHHVYCLNRSKTAREQYLEFLSSSLLPAHAGVTDSLDQRVSFFCTSSLGLPRLGLDEGDHYEKLLHANITHVIHNAWPVNFNLSLTSFTSHVAGIQALVDFCLESDRISRLISAAGHMAALIFVSSLSSVTNLSSRTRVSESIVTDPSAPAHTGYGESKYVAERILDEANNRIPHLRTTILRVGQIAGPITNDAIWPAREWLPSLIISSKTLDALPSDLGKMNEIDWIPVDILAESICELVSSINEHDFATTVYHIFNHQVVPWQTLLPVVQKQTGISRTLSLNKWIDFVQQQSDVDEERTDTSESTRSNPAKKILQFYQSLDVGISSSTSSTRSNGDSQTLAANFNGVQSTQRYELDRLRSVSASFRSLKPVSSEWMTKWIKGWL